MPIYVDTIVCELIRPERNNKLSLLGVFGKAIFLPRIPTKLASLAFAQRWEPATDELEGTNFVFIFEIRGPGLETIRPPERRITVGPGPYPQLNIALEVRGFPIAEEGNYEFATFIDGRESNIYEFFVAVPTAEQRQRLQLTGFQ